ncbi:MAG: fused MFS/spermidine synthase, partial [Phycisphaerae bacterium]
AAPPAERPESASRAKRHVLMLAFFVSGLVSIGYEIIWMRSASFLLGGFTYVFSGVLTVYLLGNVLGAWIGSRLSRRLKLPAVGFGVSLGCLGVLGVLYLPWFVAWFLKLEPLVSPLLGGSLGAAGIRKAAMPLFHSAVLFFLPAVAMGVGFPLALQAWSGLRPQVGRATGTVYGANTIGAVLGGVVSGFVLIPLMGVQLSITLLGLLAVWLGWAMVQLFAAKGRVAPRVACSAAAVAVTIAAAAIPTSLFRQDVVGGRPGEVLAVREGITATVAVHRKPDGHLIMSIDNVPMAGDDIHRSAQKTLGHLAVLLHGDTREVLSVGFGAGETSACLAEHGLDRIDCVEIAPEVVEVALGSFSHINLGDRLDREVNMMYMDAKNYLNLTDRRYDIIINDSDVHSTSGSAPLFTREHFSSALKRLKVGGLFVTKLHLQGHPKSNFDSILATFLEVYPHVTVWFPTTRPFIFFYLVGSREQQLFSPARIDAELRKEKVRRGVEYLNFRSSSDVLSCYIGDKDDLRRYLKDGRINSDYAPYIEFNLDCGKLVLQKHFLKFVGTVRRESVFRHLDWTGVAAEQRARWEADHRLLYSASSFALLAHGTRGFLERLQYAFFGLRYAPQHRALLDVQDRSLSGVRRALDMRLVSPDRLVTDMDILLRREPRMGTASLVKSWALARKGDLAGAFGAGTKAAGDAPRVAAAQTNLGAMLLGLGEADAALRHFEKAIRIDPDDAYTLETFAWCLATCPKSGIRNGARAVELAGRAAKAGGYADPVLMDTLAAAYAEAGRFAEAIAAAEKALGLVKPPQKSLANGIRSRLALYRAGRAYRDEPQSGRPAGS